MENCLLIGNGLNRCCGGISWEDLLEQIAKRYFVSSDTVNSNVLAFEQLKCTVMSRNFNVSSEDFAFEILKNLDTLDYLSVIDLYKPFLDLPVKNILTTNFDYSIERTLKKDYEYEKYTKNVVMPQETKCSKIRHTKIDDKNIFHIHGELGKKTTVCMGNIHYATNLISIMNSILDYDKKTDTYNIKNSVINNDELLSWAQFFFTCNVYIIGLGLYECDIDLWWLISYRKQLIQEGRRLDNKIVYYYLYEEKNQNFQNCLEAMNVEVRERQIDENNWKDSYKEISNDLKSLVEV